MGELFGGYSWETLLAQGIKKMMLDIGLDNDHTIKTPDRYVNALHEFTSGYKADPGPIAILETSFEEVNYDQMIFVNDISFNSLCIHHLVPFKGKVHFGYIPDGKIVGLSKIPRIVDIFSKRLQIQEKLTHQIASVFFDVVKPKGCGVIIEAVHFCICSRGIEKEGSYTRTCALKGSFLSHYETKQEFIGGAKRLVGSLL